MLVMILVLYFSLLVQGKVTKEKTLFLRYFCLIRQNRNKAPKFSPRLQKFLTEPSCYTEEKEDYYRNSILQLKIKC